MNGSELYVTYLIKGADTDSELPRSTSVRLPNGIRASAIPQHVRESIRPKRVPDPTDNYAGQSPDQVIILNMIKLADLK